MGISRSGRNVKAPERLSVTHDNIKSKSYALNTNEPTPNEEQKAALFQTTMNVILN